MRATMRSSSIARAFVVLVIALAAKASARITHHVVDKDDRSLILLREPFGFAKGGGDGDRAEGSKILPTGERATGG